MIEHDKSHLPLLDMSRRPGRGDAARDAARPTPRPCTVRDGQAGGGRRPAAVQGTRPCCDGGRARVRGTRAPPCIMKDENHQKH